MSSPSGSAWEELHYIPIISKIGGAFSCAGSAYILQDVLRDPNKRTKSIYHRIMVGLSTMDILYSFFIWFIGSWAMPKGSWPWAVGNIATCDAVGFLGGLGFVGSPLYNCSLATFYFLQLKCDWSDRRMKAIEKWLHIVPCSISLVACTTFWAVKMLGPNFGNCAISQPYPWGCNKPESEVECIRSSSHAHIYWLIASFNLLFSSIYVPVTMFAVYKHVRTTELNALRHSFLAKFRGHNKKKTLKRSRRVMTQGILYSAAMLMLYILIFLSLMFINITKKSPTLCRILIHCIVPLQGVFNMCIYLVPVFRRMLKTYRQSKDDGKEKRKISTDSTLVSSIIISSPPKKTVINEIIEKEEEKMEILVQQTFNSESRTGEGNREEEYGHLAVIDDVECANNNSGDEFY